jgi:hypothetical protein
MAAKKQGWFQEWQDEWSRTRWVGCDFIAELDGGGNADSDGDHDPIESRYDGYHGIDGPESPVKGGNNE